MVVNQGQTIQNILLQFPFFGKNRENKVVASVTCPECNYLLDRPHAFRCSRCRAEIPQALGCSGCGKCRKK